MLGKSSAMRFALVVSGLLLFGYACAAAAEPAEVKVLTSVALTSVFDQIAPQFQQATGNKLKIGFSLIADIKKRMMAGETADVIILSRPAMGDLQKLDKFAPGSVADIAGTPVAVAARAGAAKPDISSVDALKRTLLDARMIVYADPAKGGASGVYFAHVIDQLGIAEQLKSRTILVPGAQSAEVVAKGLADIGVAQGSEILPVPGVQLVGPLPGQFASTTVFTGGIGADTKVPEAAKSLLQFLKGPAGMAVFKSKGFEPE